jgi:hypothetical protein
MSLFAGQIFVGNFLDLLIGWLVRSRGNLGELREKMHPLSLEAHDFEAF